MSRAASHRGVGGGSRKRSCERSRAPQSDAASTVAESSERMISGGVSGASGSLGSQHRMQSPGPRRPARPRLWSAAAALTRSVMSLFMPLRGWKRAMRAQPESTTARTPGTVRLVSATFVASTMRGGPPSRGRVTARCSASGIIPCRRAISAPGAPRSRWACTRRISRAPARNTSTSPPVSSSAASEARATAAASKPAARTRQQAAARASWRVSTGCDAPRDGEARAADEPGDAPRVERGGHHQDPEIRAAARARRAAARAPGRRARSARGTRPGSRGRRPRGPGSSRRRRSRRPSVTTSMRVARLARRSCRTAYPAVSPTRSPSSSAMRAAAAAAAIRRGSSMTMRLPSRKRAPRSAGGTMVVLPAPGSAWSTRAPSLSSAASMRSSHGTTGRA